MELPTALFSPSSKTKKNPPVENFLYSGKMELSSSNIKKFLIFRKRETPKKFFIFQETGLSYTSGNRNFKKPLIFSEMELSELEK